MAKKTDEIIEIRDPEIRVPELMNQIRQNMNERAKKGPLAAEAAMAEERWAVRDAIEDLRRQITAYGSVGSGKEGGAAKLELLVKKVVRKVIRRHIDQQKDVHEALLKALDQLEKFQGQQNAFMLERIEKASKDPRS